MKLKYLKMHDLSDVPDHVIEELRQMAMSMIENLNSITKGKNANLVLGAMNWVHAAVINNVVSPEEVEKCGLMSAQCLLKNVEMLVDIRKNPLSHWEPR
jgi:hypothetical protein